jgi:hypothetical protein
MTSSHQGSTQSCIDQNNKPVLDENNAEPGTQIYSDYPPHEIELHDSQSTGLQSSLNETQTPTMIFDEKDFFDITNDGQIIMHTDSSTEAHTKPATPTAPIDNDHIHNQDDDVDMDCKSDHTVESTPTRPKTLSYSQAVRRTRPPDPEAQELITLWTNAVAEALQKTKEWPFDTTTWNPDRVLNALKDKTELQKLFNDKISSRPTQCNIPPAIGLKFKHRDTAFFRTFTRDRKSKPAHQIEYEESFNKALRNYKRQHNVTITNKTNRDQIYTMLKKKLAANYISNLNFTTSNPHQITATIYYCAKFAQTEDLVPFESMRKLLGEALSDNLEPLPDNPDLIPEHNTELLPFTLLLTERKYTRAVMASLRKIYSFPHLPAPTSQTTNRPFPMNQQTYIALSETFFQLPTMMI